MDVSTNLIVAIILQYIYIYMYQINMSYISNLHNVVYKLGLNKSGKKILKRTPKYRMPLAVNSIQYPLIY